jgi:hypothetical protein
MKRQPHGSRFCVAHVFGVTCSGELLTPSPEPRLAIYRNTVNGLLQLLKLHFGEFAWFTTKLPVALLAQKPPFRETLSPGCEVFLNLAVVWGLPPTPLANEERQDTRV